MKIKKREAYLLPRERETTTRIDLKVGGGRKKNFAARKVECCMVGERFFIFILFAKKEREKNIQPW